MGWFLLHLTVNILAFLRPTVNFFPLRLTDLLKINYHCFKKLKVNFHCCKKFSVSEHSGLYLLSYTVVLSRIQNK